MLHATQHMDLKPLTVILLLHWSLTTLGADFNEIINDPKKFSNQRVTFDAMARVGGDRFYLYQPPEPKLLANDSRVIYGQLLPEGPYYKPLDHKRVRVTGVVDSEYRGLVDSNACSLIIERARPAVRVRKPKISCGAASCLEIKFSRLLENPMNYDHKCVCVTGFAHVRGDAFAIYESEKAAESGYSSRVKGVFVSPISDTADYDRYNRRWIKIRGVVDLSQRGFADYPAGLAAEDVQPASPSR